MGSEKQSLADRLIDTAPQCIFIFLLSMIFFYSTAIPVWLYLLVVASLLCSLFCLFDGDKNHRFYNKVCLGLIVNSSAFVIVKLLINGGQTIPVAELIVDLALLDIIVPEAKVLIKFSNIEEIRARSAKEDDKEKSKPFKEHDADIDEIGNKLKTTDILGINSTWGNGKTYVVDTFWRENKEKYDCIKIEALTYRYAEFDSVLINKLEKLLHENHIFSFYAIVFKQRLGNNLWEKFMYHYFQGIQPGNSSVFTGLVDELRKLPKDVLIVFEDLERVGKKEEIKRLFAIAERLASDKVKIIYEYDRAKLEGEEGLALDRGYLEKYIPVEINLSDLSYSSLVNAVWDDMHFKDEDKERINKRILSGGEGGVGSNQDLKSLIVNFPKQQQNSFGSIFSYENDNSFMGNISIRRMQTFITEISDYMLQSDAKEIEEQVAREVVAFYYVKHFAEDVYCKLRPWKKLEDIYLLSNKEEAMNIWSLTDSVQIELNENHKYDKESILDRLETVVKEDGNRESLFVYSLFGYDFSDLAMRIQYKNAMNQMTFEDALTLYRAREKREQVNRLIWNLLQRGRSESTNNKACADAFIEEVLKKEKTNWKTAFQQYCNSQRKKNNKDNRSVLNSREASLLSVVRAISICYIHDAEIWSKVCDFICDQWEEKNITIDFIQLCYYVEFNSRKNMENLISFFNSRKVVINFNRDDSYWAFLAKYIIYLSNRGYYSEHVHKMFYPEIGKKEDIVTAFKKEIEDGPKQGLLDTDSYKKCMDILREFLRKNIEIMNSQDQNLKAKPKGGSSMVWEHQEKINTLQENMDGIPHSEEKEKKLLSMLVDAFEREKLYPIEIEEVERNIEKWKTKGA